LSAPIDPARDLAVQFIGRIAPPLVLLRRQDGYADLGRAVTIADLRSSLAGAVLFRLW